MKPPPMIQRAIETLCARFEQGEYNPTPVIDLGALVAQADGDIDPSEIEALRELFQATLQTQLNPELVGYLVDASVAVIQAVGVESRVRVIAEILLDCNAVEEGLMVALAVAFASDGLAEPEREAIASLARAADLPPARFESLVLRVQAAYQVP